MSVAVWCLSLLIAGDGLDLQKARNFIIRQQRPIVEQLREFVSIPNVAADRENIRRNAAFLVEQLKQRGFAARTLEAAGANPAVFAAAGPKDAVATIMFYAHYDGQPADPDRWQSDPWQAVVRDGRLEDGGETVAWTELPAAIPGEWRVYGRAASDDKAPILALMLALDVLQAQGVEPSIRIKCFFEGEEEVGSPNLRAILNEHASLLQADAWLLCDGPVHQTRRPQLCFGARGVVGLELTVYGPAQELHSGHYGNWAPNPAMRLAHLLASMRGPAGELTIAGIEEHVRPLTASEEDAILAIPVIDRQLQQSFCFSTPEGNGASLLHCIHRPAMNVRGLGAGNVGDLARNAIPATATASIDFRLVPHLKPDLVRELVEQHVKKQGYELVYDEPAPAARGEHKLAYLRWGRGYPAYRASLESPPAAALIRCLHAKYGDDVLKIPSLGGSVPMGVFHDIFSVPAILVPIVNHDNNQHAPNENLRLANLWQGIELYALLFAELGRYWK